MKNALETKQPLYFYSSVFLMLSIYALCAVYVSKESNLLSLGFDIFLITYSVCSLIFLNSMQILFTELRQSDVELIQSMRELINMFEAQEKDEESSKPDTFNPKVLTVHFSDQDLHNFHELLCVVSGIARHNQEVLNDERTRQELPPHVYDKFSKEVSDMKRSILEMTTLISSSIEEQLLSMKDSSSKAETEKVLSSIKENSK